MNAVKKTWKLIWLGFLSVFATTKMLENVEKEINDIFDDPKKKDASPARPNPNQKPNKTPAP